MATVSSMDFFESQDLARKKTSLLVAYYFVAVILIILAVYVAVVGILVVPGLEDGETIGGKLWQPELFLWIVGCTTAVVAFGSIYKISAMGQGGKAVATMLGGRPIVGDSLDADERKILNVVEEMAIASGTPVPSVFMLDDEEGINAFAAGFTPADAVIGVTRGCVQTLSRDELQGVIAHEFSHILNGDMKLNIKLIGVLIGLRVVTGPHSAGERFEGPAVIGAMTGPHRVESEAAIDVVARDPTQDPAPQGRRPR